MSSETAVRETARVHQIYITDDMTLPEVIPPLFAEHIDRLKRLYPKAEHKLWSGAELRTFISENYDPPVVEAFDTLKSYAYKSDLARYCLLHTLGGLYVDIAMRFDAVFAPPKSYGLGIFADAGQKAYNPEAIAIGIMWAEPGRSEFANAIKAIVQNCADQHYGVNPLHPTGPFLFAVACSQAEGHLMWQPGAGTQWIGTSNVIGEGPIAEKAGPSVAYVTPDGITVATRVKPHGGDLTFAGAQNVNNYNEIWKSGTAYGETEDIWHLTEGNAFLSGKATFSHDGVDFPEYGDGKIVFDTKISLRPGRHRFSVLCSEFKNLSPALRVQVIDCDDSIVFENYFGDNQTVTRERMTIAFSTMNHHKNVRVKIAAEKEFTGTVNAISYRQIYETPLSSPAGL